MSDAIAALSNCTKATGELSLGPSTTKAHMNDIQEDLMAIELTDDNFTEVELNATQTVMVDFGAEWCGIFTNAMSAAD